MRATFFAVCLAAVPVAAEPITHNTPREFPKVESREAWEARAGDIREQVMVSCGLWPMPEKTPLQAKVFGKVEREGYSVEKVHFQPYPGFYLAGNLYRPSGKGEGPFPAILNPHGHWEKGRMADEEAGSIPARCISFARQGMIAFSYDMVGYNDTRFADWPEGGEGHRSYGTKPEDQLWGINLMGLQTWNSIRALDFLEGLPDVDRKRLACTGESGGGTQTFILGALDDRLAAQVPVVMVSHSMQGGCICENAPGLRVDHSNMEIAAAAAPRPQLIVGATGDWTKTTLEVEGPAITGIYKLLGVEDRFKALRFDFGHNYNRTSREAVYDWLGKRLLEKPESVSLKEEPYQKEPDAELRVFPDEKLPDDALTMAAFIEARRDERRRQWRKLVPTDKAGFERFKATVLPVWRRTVGTPWHPEWRERKGGPIKDLKLQETVVIKMGGGRPVDPGRQYPVEQRDGVTIISTPPLETDEKADEFSNYFTTYNETLLQRRVTLLIAMCQMVREAPPVKRVILIGEGEGGFPALLAAPAADAVAADCGGRDLANDQDLLVPGRFAPGLRSIGNFSAGAMLAAPRPLLLFDTGGAFPAGDIQAAYRASGEEKALMMSEKGLTEEEIIEWALGR